MDLSLISGHGVNVGFYVFRSASAGVEMAGEEGEIGDGGGARLGACVLGEEDVGGRSCRR